MVVLVRGLVVIGESGRGVVAIVRIGRRGSVAVGGRRVGIGVVTRVGASARRLVGAAGRGVVRVGGSVRQLSRGLFGEEGFHFI